MKQFLAMFFLLLSAFAFADETLPLRLPDDVKPILYDLSLTVIPSQDTFSGTARITIQLQKERSDFLIHGQGLTVKDTELTLENGDRIPAKYTQLNDDGLVRIEAGRAMKPQKLILEVDYDAPFNRQLAGLYRVDSAGESYAFTQMEPIAARLCFPGFDEPSFKAQFDVSMTVKKEHQAVSNAPAVSEEDLGNGMKRIRFARTQKLSTYLIAFAVGPLDIVKWDDIPGNEVRKSPLPLRGVAAKGRGKEMTYALANTAGIVALLEQYFGIPYPWEKLDIIAVPDFAWGAMENAGAITFRDSTLLLDEKTAPESQKRRYAVHMTHELAHQWFGDLVTMAWWDDIWLNESFATWMEAKILMQRNPELHMELTRLEEGNSGKGFDSLAASQPMRQPIKTTDDINGYVNSITYYKGCQVISMFEKYLGEDAFQKGIRRYLNQHLMANATAEDFFSSLSEVSGKNVTSAFRSFVEQPGIPMVSIEPSCKGKVASVRMKQSRYYPLGSKGTSGQSWQIPVCFRYEMNGKEEEKCVLSSQEEMVVLTDAGCPDWIMPNADGAGYYYWTLPPDEYAKIPFDKLSLTEQFTMGDTLLASFREGKLNFEDFHSTLESLAAAPDRRIATRPMDMLIFARNYLVSESLRPRVEAYSRKVYAPAFARLGFVPAANETEEARTLRPSVIDFLAFDAHDPEVRKQAAESGRAFLGYGTDGKIHPEVVDPNLLGICLGVAVQEGDAAFFDAVLTHLKQSNDAILRGQLLNALCRTTDVELGKRVLGLMADPDLRGNEIADIFRVVNAQPENRDRTWEWMKQNFDVMIQHFPVQLAGYLPFTGAGFCSPEKVKEVGDFFEPRMKSIPGGANALQATLEIISLCSAQVKAQRPGSEKFFAK